jgi:hypothetical protein
MRQQSKRDRRSASPSPPPPAVAPGCTSGCDHLQERQHHGGVMLEEATRVRAYQLWERAGRPPGCGVEFWLEAEAEFNHGPQPAA